MNIFLDKHLRSFGIYLIFFVLLLFLSGTVLYTAWVKGSQNMFLSHDEAVAGSLLGQGVSKDIIAKAITSTAGSREGTEFLVTVGVTKHTAIRFLPFISELRQTMGYAMLFAGVLLAVLLFGGVYVFLKKREQLYGEAARVIAHFAEGDFSRHMPQMEEGTIYHLFASVDQLAKVLQSKNETEHKTKEFLKNTISDISHQLKTPLTALIMYHEIITDEPENLDTVKVYSEKTGLALKRMEYLIQAMLKITRLDAGSIVFNKEACPIPELIAQSVRELVPRAEKEEKEICIEGAQEDLVVCDKQWTSEAVGNIVKNALDHTDRGGIIRITWEHTPAMLRIFISDNGSGIAPEDTHHIFKRFYHSEKSLDTQGIGLGLSLAKSIIEGQGGIISFQSSLKEGTTFVLSFLTEL
jgi:signal transduction histidine kinase